jgi:hypothetical protein
MSWSSISSRISLADWVGLGDFLGQPALAASSLPASDDLRAPARPARPGWPGWRRWWRGARPASSRRRAWGPALLTSQLRSSVGNMRSNSRASSATVLARASLTNAVDCPASLSCFEELGVIFAVVHAHGAQPALLDRCLERHLLVGRVFRGGARSGESLSCKLVLGSSTALGLLARRTSHGRILDATRRL